jgi:hypothetical protein
MEPTIKILGNAGALLALTLLAGCGSYYMVRDPSNGTIYYTSDVVRAGDAGAVRFRDEKTGKVVTIPQSEVKEIDKYEFRSATVGPQSAR